VGRYRLAPAARVDIAAVLRNSETLHGAEARVRYRALLTAALRRIAADPEGRTTIDCSELFAGVRSFHIRHSRNESRESPVGQPVHVIFYRASEPGLVEIVRVLHERMDPGWRVDVES